jgi:hypothetical protein
MFLKQLVNTKLLTGLLPFRERGQDGEYRRRVAIISYYLSQIPLMAMQFVMNKVRDIHKTQHNETREQNRDTFKGSHVANRKLLMKLSQIKDFMGFWIKASLNDMMNDDPAIKAMVLSIDQASLEGFMISRTQNMWAATNAGMVAYTGVDQTDLYKNSIKAVVTNLVAMASTMGAIAKPSKKDIPTYTDHVSGTRPEDLLDYTHGAPFMARPDTYVPLHGGHLAEVRGLNKKIADNVYMKGFQMPYFRRSGGHLADRHSEILYPRRPRRIRAQDQQQVQHHEEQPVHHQQQHVHDEQQVDDEAQRDRKRKHTDHTESSRIREEETLLHRAKAEKARQEELRERMNRDPFK